MKLILASNSPRRKQLLTEYGYTFNVIKSDFNEENIPKMSIKQTPRYLANAKAMTVFEPFLGDAYAVCLGADTIVVYNGKIIGKPKDNQDAVRTLKMLSGKKHFVYTGYSIVTSSKTITGLCKSTVYFNNLSDELIKEYVDSGSPLDKAGSYGIQDGYPIVKKYKGSLNNIIGLPIEKINKILKKLM